MPRTYWIALMLLTAGCVLAENSPLKPPANCATLTIGQTEYLRGEVYLASHQDTAALRHFGFKRLEFTGRSLGSVKYSAIWPRAVPLDSLAAFVSGLDYELAEDDGTSDAIVLNPSPELKSVIDYLSSTVDTLDKSQPYRRVIVNDFGSGGVEVYYRYVPTAKGVRKYDIEDLNRAIRGNFHVTPVEKGPLHKKEILYLPNASYRGLIHVLPIEEGPIRKWQSVVVPDDPGVGTFFVQPGNSDRYHAPSTVVTKNHPAVGTFHVMPDPKASGLRPTDFGILRDYSTFRVGQTFFVTPNADGRPRTMSVNEWRRLHIK